MNKDAIRSIGWHLLLYIIWKIGDVRKYFASGFISYPQCVGYFCRITTYGYGRDLGV